MMDYSADRRNLTTSALALGGMMALLAPLGFSQAHTYELKRFEQSEIAGERALKVAESFKNDGLTNPEIDAENRRRAAETGELARQGFLLEGQVIVMANGEELSETYPMNMGYRAVTTNRTWASGTFSLQQRGNRFHVVDQKPYHLSLLQPAGQLALTNQLDPRLAIVETREGGRIEVYQMPSDPIPNPNWPDRQYEMVVKYTAAGSNEIELVTTRLVNSWIDIPLERLEVSGKFGEPGYKVSIHRLLKDRDDGSSPPPTELTYVGPSSEYFSPDSIPAGALIADARTPNTSHALNYQWSGEFAEVEANSGSPIPMPIWYMLAATGIVGLGVWFWRKR